MRLLFISHIQNARDSLRSNRMRTTLTMLGVTIGVASVTTILALGGGASKIVSDQVDSLGGTIAVVRPTSAAASPLSRLGNLQSSDSFTASTLTDTDLSSLSAIDGVSAIAPLMVLSGAVKGDLEASASTTILATTPALATISGLDVRIGQFLDTDISQDTVVLGPQASVGLFGTEESIGKSVTIRGKDFTVVGVLQHSNSPINYNNVDMDSAVIINVASARQINQGSSQIQQIDIQSKSVSDLQHVVQTGNQALLQNHLGETDFAILSGSQIAQPTSELFYIVAGVTTAIAGISLLVGGIGIMNIMLVSVSERTREIGIRKALGASNADIVWQFLIESLALSIGGGIAGYVLGYAVAFVVSTFLTFDPLLNWQIAAIAGVISLVIGTVFGLYPAIRAARKDPIKALRQYD